MNDQIVLPMAGMILFAWLIAHCDWYLKLRRFRSTIDIGTPCEVKLWNRKERAMVISIEPDGMLMVFLLLDMSIHRVGMKSVYPL